MTRLSIVIPAYNEEKRIKKTLEEYYKFFESKKNEDFEFEILIVINNTKDLTEKIVKDFSKNKSEIRYLNLKQGGKGFAIKEGFKDALKRNNDLIGFVDADLATSPNAFYSLFQNIKSWEGIIANRRLKGSIVYPDQAIQRVLAGRIFNFIVRILFFFPYSDTQCGAKLFKREALKKIVPMLGMTRWAFDIEILYLFHKNGFRIKQIKTEWRDVADSKLRLGKVSMQMLFASLRLRIVNSPFKKLLKPLKPLLDKLWNKLDKF